jgi:hypothetical protein
MMKARNHREYQGVDEFTILKWTARVCGVDVDMIIYPRIGPVARCYEHSTQTGDCVKGRGTSLLLLLLLFLLLTAYGFIPCDKCAAMLDGTIQ